MIIFLFICLLFYVHILLFYVHIFFSFLFLYYIFVLLYHILFHVIISYFILFVPFCCLSLLKLFSRAARTWARCRWPWPAICSYRFFLGSFRLFLGFLYFILVFFLLLFVPFCCLSFLKLFSRAARTWARRRSPWPANKYNIYLSYYIIFYIHSITCYILYHISYLHYITLYIYIYILVIS